MAIQHQTVCYGGIFRTREFVFEMKAHDISSRVHDLLSHVHEMVFSTKQKLSLLNIPT